MNNLSKVFERGRALIAFITAGDPTFESSVKYALALERGGADIVELGIPFSDPTAEGTEIQDANIRALSKGMNAEGTFEIAEQVRKMSDIPPFEEREEILGEANKNGVCVISSVAPAPAERIRMIAENAQGFMTACGTFEEQNALAVKADEIVAVQAAAPEQAAQSMGGAVTTGCGAVNIIAMLGEHAEGALEEYAVKMKRALYAR